jgi:hypothetical protein
MPHNSVCVHGNTHVGGRLCPECAESTFICDKGYAHVGGALCRKCSASPADAYTLRHNNPCGTTVVHVNDASYDVYIGREFRRYGHDFAESIWGNVNHLPQDEYEAYVRSRPDLMARLPELKGKSLGCWHREPRKGCHGDVLVKLVNELCGDE